jgi:MFS family permease
MSVGIIVSAFAGGGLIVSSMAGSAITAADPQISFAVIGTVLLGVGVAAALVLDNRLLAQPNGATDFSQNVTVLSSGLLALISTFFLISYVGLMTVSHITTMLSAKELATQLIALGPVVVTLGYLIGSFFGGKLVEAIGSWPVLILANVLDALGLTALALPIGSWALFAALIVGTVFGSSASFMPVIIGDQFGVHQIGLIYGKVMFSYGGAGLLAPWITGWIFVKTGGYALALLIGIVGSILGAVIGLTIARSSRV